MPKDKIKIPMTKTIVRFLISFSFINLLVAYQIKFLSIVFYELKE